MTSSERKRQFDECGYVIVRQFLDEAELADLRGNLDRYIRDVVPTLPDSHAFYHEKGRPETLKQMQNMGVDPYFHAYPKNPKWKALAAELIGEVANGHDPEWFSKPSGINHPTPPHQDNYYFNLKPPNVITVWLALDIVDDENGCLRYVPGSHRKGVRPHGRSNVLGFSQGITDFGLDDEANEVRVHLQPGDVAVHHGQTIHRADPNRSTTRKRRAFAIVYQGVSCRRDEESFARYQDSVKRQHEQMGLKTG